MSISSSKVITLSVYYDEEDCINSSEDLDINFNESAIQFDFPPFLRHLHEQEIGTVCKQSPKKVKKDEVPGPINPSTSDNDDKK